MWHRTGPPRWWPAAAAPTEPDPLRDPAEPYRPPQAPSSQPDWLPLQLHACSWVFPRGHRIRLAISNAMWPMIWPTPHPATATVRLGPTGTRLVLPVVPAAERPAPVFGDFEPSEELDGVRSWGDVLPVRWTLVRDDKGVASISWRGTAGQRVPVGTGGRRGVPPVRGGRRPPRGGRRPAARPDRGTSA